MLRSILARELGAVIAKISHSPMCAGRSAAAATAHRAFRERPRGYRLRPALLFGSFGLHGEVFAGNDYRCC